MYPSRFRYEAPRSLEEAIALLREGDGEAKVLAGGQSLVPLLKLRFASPELLVDINNLPGLGHHVQDAEAHDPVDIDDPGGPCAPEVEQRHQALAAGQHLGLAVALAEQRDRLLEAARGFVPEP